MNNKKVITKNCQTMTVKQVKEYLGLGTAAAYALFQSEGFPSLKIGRQLFVRRQSFMAWLTEVENRKGGDSTWQDAQTVKAV